MLLPRWKNGGSRGFKSRRSRAKITREVLFTFDEGEVVKGVSNISLPRLISSSETCSVELSVTHGPESKDNGSSESDAVV